MDIRHKPRVSFLLFLGVVVLQLWWIFRPAPTDVYRIKELAQAVEQAQDNPSPATEATLERQFALRREHQTEVLRNAIILFLLVDGVFIGFLWKDHRKLSAC